MATFRYRGRRGQGELVEGTLEAMSMDAAAGQLLATGVTPVDISETLAPSAAATGFSDWLRGGYPDITDLILFSRQMYTLLRAGVPINRAMTGLIRSCRNAVLADVLKDIQASLESGREFSAALSAHPRVFPNLYIAMVRVGENTGRLDEAMLQLAEYLEQDKDTRARVKGALRYPSFVVIAIAAAVAIINWMVIPQFRNVFARAGVDLPLPTRILIGTSDFFVAYWMYIIVAIVGTVVFCRWFIGTPGGRAFWDRAKLNLPIVGDIVFRATMARFSRAFAMSLAAGVPLIQALNVVSRAVDNEHIGERILSIRAGVERGDTLTRTAAGTGMFSPLVLQMLEVGEETGAIDTLMEEVAGFYEREVDYDIKNLSQTIEPVLIVVLAGMVLILALGIFLPMWDLAAVKL